MVRSHIETADEAELQREVEVLENGTTPVLERALVVLEEAFEHLRYARRDLALLG